MDWLANGKTAGSPLFSVVSCSQGLTIQLGMCSFQ
jgi:hypothetical protein